MVPLKSLIKVGLSLSLLANLCSCASSSLFNSYPNQMAAIKQDLTANRCTNALSNLKAHFNSHDSFLYHLEAGRIEQLTGHYKASLATYQQAINQLQAYQNRAKYTVRGGASQLGSLLSNDNVIPYHGLAYEHILLYQYQAMNYLALHQFDNAMVMMRRANSEQALAVQNHEKDIEAAKKSANQHHLNVNPDWSNSKFNLMNQQISTVKNGFENAYTYYFEGLLYEAEQQPSNAYILYTKALNLMPHNITLQQAVLRLGQATSAPTYYLYKGKIKAPLIRGKANQGQLVVLYEEGFLPAKQQTKLILPGLPGIVGIAIPYYNSPVLNPSPLDIFTLQHNLLGHTVLLAELQTLAAKALREQMPIIITRTVIRALLQREAQRQANKNDAGVLSLALGIYSALITNADLRSWLTLPNNVQSFQTFMPQGQHTLLLRAGGLTKKINFTLYSQHITVLWVIHYRQHLAVKTLNL